MTTDSQMSNRAELAMQAYEIALDNTESFEVQGIGVALAYLMGAILKDQNVDVHSLSKIPSQVGLNKLYEIYEGLPGTEGILIHFNFLDEPEGKKKKRKG